MKRRDFLVEIGTEELPPKSLLALAEAFRDGVAAGLDAADLAHGAALAYATPRRLAVLRAPALAANRPSSRSSAAARRCRPPSMPPASRRGPRPLSPTPAASRSTRSRA